MDQNRTNNLRNGARDENCAASLIYSGKIVNEMNNDFILPDYMPDAKKVVWTVAKPVIDGRFLGAGSLEYEGKVYYNVLYIDENNQIKSVKFTADFANKVEHEELSEESVDILIPHTEQIITRLVNPRKFSIRGKVYTVANIWNRKCFLPEVYGIRSMDDENSIERRFDRRPAMNIVNARQTDLKVSEDIVISPSDPPIGEIVYQNAAVYMDDCRASVDKLTCKGNFVYSCIYKPEGEENTGYVFVRQSFPVTEVIEAERLTDAHKCVVVEIPGTLTSEVQADAAGERRIIEVDYTYGLDAECGTEKRVNVVTDMYSTKQNCENIVEDTELYTVHELIRGNFTVERNYPLDVVIPNGISDLVSWEGEIELSCGEPSRRNHIFLDGDAVINALILDSDGNPTPITLEAPVSFETDRVMPEGEMKCKVCAHIEDLVMRTDAHHLIIRFEVFFTALIYTENEVTTVSVSKLLPEERTETIKPVSILLYYPSPGESLWSVAKKYGTTRQEIMKTNNLKQEDEIFGTPLKITKPKNKK